MADKPFTFFGFEIKKSTQEESKDTKLKSIVPPTDEDGAGYITAAGHHYGHYLDISSGNEAKDNVELIKKYRSAATHPEVDMAIDEIVNEVIITGDNKQSLEINLDSVKLTPSVKKKIFEEFDSIYSMLNFSELGHDIFRSWYVDGRLYHHLVVDQNNTKSGIQEIRHIDSTKIRKVKNVKYTTDSKTGAKIVGSVDEFYIFDDKPNTTGPVISSGPSNKAIQLSTDSVSYITSGLLDEQRKRVISHIHKAIKPVNQLRMMEDSLVIYRLSRAPERRIFYIDVGNLPRGKAEQYMKDIMARYRNKLVYDASTGQLKDDRKHMSMLEDFWLPRKEGGRGTEISTLPGGQNLGEIDDILYFQKKLYRALNVPANRLEQESSYTLGRSSEIQRDELKFQKFVDRLRTRFGKLFTDILRKQLVLKNIITEEDWREIKNDIFIDYKKDNHFTELKEGEIMRERLSTLDQTSQYIGQFFSNEWVMKNVLKMTEEEISEIKKQMTKEKQEGDVPEYSMNQSAVMNQQPQPEETPEPEQEQQKQQDEEFTREDELTESMTLYLNKLINED